MKNLLTQDPPDHGLWTRDKSFFFKLSQLCWPIGQMSPINCGVFMVLSDLHLPNLFCHCESLVYDSKSTHHFSTKKKKLLNNFKGKSILDFGCDFGS